MRCKAKHGKRQREQLGERVEGSIWSEKKNRIKLELKCR